MQQEEYPLPLPHLNMSDNGLSINQSNESPMSTRPPSPTREEWAEVICKKYPALTDQEIQRLVGLDNSQLSLLSQIQGGAISPRSAQNIIQLDPNLHPTVLRGIIDSIVETARCVENRHAVEKGLLEEALDD